MQNTGNKGSWFGWLVGWLVGCWHHWDLDLGKIMLFIFYFFLKEV